MKYNTATMKILRQRIGDYGSENDTSLDAEIDEMPGREVTKHLIAWKLGSPDWLDWFIGAVEIGGGKVVFPGEVQS